MFKLNINTPAKDDATPAATGRGTEYYWNRRRSAPDDMPSLGSRASVVNGVSSSGGGGTIAPQGIARRGTVRPLHMASQCPLHDCHLTAARVAYLRSLTGRFRTIEHPSSAFHSRWRCGTQAGRQQSNVRHQRPSNILAATSSKTCHRHVSNEDIPS